MGRGSPAESKGWLLDVLRIGAGALVMHYVAMHYVA